MLETLIIALMIAIICTIPIAIFIHFLWRYISHDYDGDDYGSHNY